MHYGSLAATGATLTIGGIVLEQGWLIGIATGLILAGGLLIRVGFRRGKNVGDI